MGRPGLSRASRQLNKKESTLAVLCVPTDRSLEFVFVVVQFCCYLSGRDSGLTQNKFITIPCKVKLVTSSFYSRGSLNMALLQFLSHSFVISSLPLYLQTDSEFQEVSLSCICLWVPRSQRNLSGIFWSLNLC